MLGIDCTSYPSAQAVRDAGMSFVWGYISSPGNRKNITRAKVTEYAAAGIGVPLIFETTAARAGQGYSAGIADANSGVQQQAALGIPPEYEIYYAVDYDATGPAVLPYFQGLAAVPGDDSSYGGIKVISFLLDQRMIHHAWQTAAWSRGLVDPRAAVFQRIGTRFIDGIACDVDESFIPYFGQYPIKETAMAFFDDTNAAVLAWRTYAIAQLHTEIRGGAPEVIQGEVVPISVLLREMDANVKSLQKAVADLQQQVTNLTTDGIKFAGVGEIVVKAV